MKKPLNLNITLTKRAKYILLSSVVVFLLWFGCNRHTEKQPLDLLNTGQREQNVDDVVTKSEMDDTLRSKGLLTDTLLTTDSIKEKYIKGIIEVPLSQLTYVSLPLGGMIDKIYVNESTYIKRGALLATVTHPDYVILQQQFLESKAKLNYLKEEFRRQGELTIEHASSIKKLQKAEAEYLTEEVRYLGLKAQLEMVNINADDIQPDKLTLQLKVTSPVSGYVTHVNAKTGKYIQPNDWLFEITDMTKLQLSVMLDRNLADQVKKGDSIEFFVPGEKKMHKAKIEAKSLHSNQANKIETIAFLSNSEVKTFLPGMSVNCSFTGN